MKRISIMTKVAIAALPVATGGIALAAQDRFTVAVPGGLSFAEFRGYESWQYVAVSATGDGVKVIAANPAMIEAYRAGVPGNGKPFPDGLAQSILHIILSHHGALAHGSPVVPCTRRPSRSWARRVRRPGCSTTPIPTAPSNCWSPRLCGIGKSS